MQTRLSGQVGCGAITTL